MLRNDFDNVFYGLSVNLLRVNCATHPPLWTEEKTTSDYVLWSIIDGCVSIQIGGRTLQAEAGDAILFYPGEQYTAGSIQSCKFLYIYFTLKTGHALDLLHKHNCSGIVSGTAVKAYRDAFCSMVLEDTAPTENLSLRLYSCFLSYITEILYCRGTQYAKPFHPLPPTIEPNDLWDAITYIHEHCTQCLQAKHVAQHLHLSEKHFITKFKAKMGISPKQYITKCKMEKAMELIKTSSAPMNRIARAVGYSDQYSFSKAFKNFYGDAPSFYRTHAEQQLD